MDFIEYITDILRQMSDENYQVKTRQLLCMLIQDMRHEEGDKFTDEFLQAAIDGKERISIKEKKLF